MLEVIRESLFTSARPRKGSHRCDTGSLNQLTVSDLGKKQLNFIHLLLRLQAGVDIVFALCHKNQHRLSCLAVGKCHRIIHALKIVVNVIYLLVFDDTSVIVNTTDQ